MIYGTIICLGDSLTSGARDEYNHGWPYELEQLLWKKYNQIWCCINAGINKETSIDIYRRSYDIMKKYQEASELILLCGTNDTCFQTSTPPDKFIEHVKSILRYCQVWNLIPYVCTIPYPIGFGNRDIFVPGMMEEYNKLLRTLDCVVELSLSQDDFVDGVHLNNKGAKLVACKLLHAIEDRRFYK